MDHKELLKGTLKTIILKLLRDNHRMYGYEITQKVKLLTEDEIQITEGALYPSLHKLESEGLLKHEIEMIGNRSRKYYKLTKEGQKAVIQKQINYNHFSKLMQLILK